MSEIMTLYNAVNTDNIELVRKVFIHTKPSKKYINTVFPITCFSGRVDIMKYFIDKGADDFNTGLIYACNDGNLEGVNILLMCGANNYQEALCQIDNTKIENYPDKEDDYIQIRNILVDNFIEASIFN